MPTNDELKAQQKAIWSAVAPGWDAWDARIDEQSHAITAWLCKEARIKPGDFVLDLACGSGQPSITAAAIVGSSGKVLATDISPQMLNVARAKAALAGATNMEFREMDAESIDLPDESVDAVTMRFGLMFCPEPVKAAAEILRVLKPRGSVALSVWAEPAKSPYLTLVNAPLARFVQLPAPDPQAPGLFRLAAPGALESVLKTAGFHSVRVEECPYDGLWEGAADYWGQQQAIVGPVRALLANLSPEDAVRLRDAVFAAVEPYTENGKVRLRATPLCALGVKQ